MAVVVVAPEETGAMAAMGWTPMAMAAMAMMATAMALRWAMVAMAEAWGMVVRGAEHLVPVAR